MREAEQKADEYINDPKNLTLNSLIKMANYGLEGFYHPGKLENSQDSKAKSEETSVKAGYKNKHQDSDDDIDKEMNDDHMDDYDDQSHQISSNRNKGNKKTKTKQKEKDQSFKSVSNESIDRFNGNGKDDVIDEDMEEEDLLKRELGGGDSDHQSESQKQNIESQGKDSKGNTTTTDSNNQVQKPKEVSKKSIKSSAK